MTGSDGLTYEFPELFPRERLRELILYIADKLQDDERGGITKLAKIIYFADFEAWRTQGKPVTGTKWKRMPHGPLPSDFYEILDELTDSRRISIKEGYYHGFPQKRIETHSAPSTGLFGDSELQVVDRVIQKFSGWNAKELSALAHAGAAWRMTNEEYYIPYEYALYSDEPLTEEEEKHARDLALRYRDYQFD